MNKIKQIFIWFFLAFLLPLLGKPGLLIHWRIGILVAIWALLIAIEPAPSESRKVDRESWKTDAGTKNRIAIAGLISIWIPIIEWAYLWDYQWVANLFGYPGLFLIIIGVTIRTWAIILLGEYFDSRARTLKDHQLIRKGPFSIVRHPCYLGSVLIFIGSAFFLSSLMGALISGVLMVSAYRKRIEVEEVLLKKKFPKEYSDLSDKSWKLFPFVY